MTLYQDECKIFLQFFSSLIIACLIKRIYIKRKKNIDRVIVKLKKCKSHLCSMHDTKHTIAYLVSTKFQASHMTPTNQEYKHGNLKIPHNIFISTLIRAPFKACS